MSQSFCLIWRKHLYINLFFFCLKIVLYAEIVRFVWGKKNVFHSLIKCFASVHAPHTAYMLCYSSRSYWADS